MLNTNTGFISTPNNIEALFEAFFKVEPDAHVKDWRWNCFRTGNYHYSPKYSNNIVYGSRADG